jgi:hypothetical protein
VAWPAPDALEVFGRPRALMELQQSAVLLQERIADLGGNRDEELSAFVKLTRRSSRRVMPILAMFGPNAPTFEMTYTYPAGYSRSGSHWPRSPRSARALAANDIHAAHARDTAAARASAGGTIRRHHLGRHPVTWPATFGGIGIELAADVWRYSLYVLSLPRVHAIERCRYVGSVDCRMHGHSRDRSRNGR